MINNSKHLIRHYSIIPLFIIAVFLSTKLLLEVSYGIELTLFSEEAFFLICTSLWLILVFLTLRTVVLGRFKQQAWYFAFLIVFAKWPIDWAYHKLILLEMITNNIWLSLYYPVVWTGMIYFSLRFCTIQSNENNSILSVRF